MAHGLTDAQWGFIEPLLPARAQDLERRGKIKLDECFIDDRFSAAKKGAPASVKPSATA